MNVSHFISLRFISVSDSGEITEYIFIIIFKKSCALPKNAEKVAINGKKPLAAIPIPIPTPTESPCPSEPVAALNEDYTRVVLQLDRETEFQKEVLSNPDRIFFDLLNSQMDRKLVNWSYDVNGLLINKIRVGINRPGVVRPTGLKEKDLVLEVGLKLRDYLVNRLGIDVTMTRDRDVYVPLEERTAIANQVNADLFISIHANGSRNRRVRGIETFVLDFSSNDDERRVASMENAGSQRTIAALEDLLRSIARGDYKQKSRDLAQVVQTKLHSKVSRSLQGQRNRGVKQAPFIVLIGSNMPSILTEVGFISNPSDEKYYKSDESRNLLAEALYTGVENYFQSLGSFQPASSAAGTGDR